MNDNSNKRSVKINGVLLFDTKWGASYANGESPGFEYIVFKGDKVKATNWNSMKFYPYSSICYTIIKY